MRPPEAGRGPGAELPGPALPPPGGDTEPRSVPAGPRIPAGPEAGPGEDPGEDLGAVPALPGRASAHRAPSCTAGGCAAIFALPLPCSDNNNPARPSPLSERGHSGEGGAGPSGAAAGGAGACGARGWSRGRREPRSALPAAARRRRGGRSRRGAQGEAGAAGSREEFCCWRGESKGTGGRQERKRCAGKGVQAERQRQTTGRTKVIKKRGRGDTSDSSDKEEREGEGIRKDFTDEKEELKDPPTPETANRD